MRLVIMNPVIPILTTTMLLTRPFTNRHFNHLPGFFGLFSHPSCFTSSTSSKSGYF